MKINVKSVIEAALFVAGNDGVSAETLHRISRLSSENFNAILEEMIIEYEKDDQRGIIIKKVGNLYRFYTKPIIGKIISKYFGISNKINLTNQMIEILIIIAYNEPCTKSKIMELKKIDPTPILEKLIELELVHEAGRGFSVGRPYLYQVSPKFYDIFGINSLQDLPKIKIPDETIKSDELEEKEETTSKEAEKEKDFFNTNRER